MDSRRYLQELYYFSKNLVIHVDKFYTVQAGETHTFLKLVE
jgi:hypothetical protein